MGHQPKEGRYGPRDMCATGRGLTPRLKARRRCRACGGGCQYSVAVVSKNEKTHPAKRRRDGPPAEHCLGEPPFSRCLLLLQFGEFLPHFPNHRIGVRAEFIHLSVLQIPLYVLPESSALPI